jgi:hypothetical protein
MNDFLQTALSFPTVVFSVVLAVCVVYWLLASTGLVDGEAADTRFGGDGDPGTASGAAAMLSRVGLDGVPAAVSLTVFSFTAWFGTYFVHLLALRHLPEALVFPAAVATLLAVPIPSLVVTAVMLRPLRRTLAKIRPPTDAVLLGRVGTLVTPSLDSGYGQASVDDGGAGLLLQVRLDEPNQLVRGDRVVLIEYLEGQHAYRVISEQQFLGAPNPSTSHES